MKKILILAIVLLLLGGSFFYFYYQVYYYHGNPEKRITFSIQQGETVAEISSQLEVEKIISGKIYFYYYLKRNNLEKRIIPGDYVLTGNMTIPEIVYVLTENKEEAIRVTFPEGWNSREMAKRLTEKGLPGEEFLALTKKTDQFSERYSFLQSDNLISLEGYLFPDTYLFKKEATAEEIIIKMLSNFENRMTPKIKQAMESEGKEWSEIVTMASLIEKEVPNKGDREIVSGIFWERISLGMPLQSCATLAYVLGENKRQYSYEDTQIKSPYNTYLNKGLPPGPIGNPGLLAIEAAIFSQKTNYLYFLSNPETGKTYFARTLEEHNFNKANNSL